MWREVAKQGGAWRGATICALLMLCGGITLSAWADPIGANDGVIYRLEASSTYQEGCFPPCLCPLWIEQGLLGTMRVTYQGFDGVLHRYHVDDVNWLAYRPDGTLLRVTGRGVYMIGTPGPITLVQQRMELDLKINDDPVEHYDSGWVPVGDSTRINIAVSINGMYCLDRAIRIDALPVPASQLRPYRLVPGSTFQRGCFDPCDCLLGPELPVVGSFALVPLRIADFADLHAVVNIRWQVQMSSSASELLPIHGFGFYERMVGDAAHLQRLQLELEIGDEPVASFDSGQIWGGEIFPTIDAVVSQQMLVCYDTAIHVVGEPLASNVCGGIGGVPCPNGQFCFYPIGTCGQGDIEGMCLPLGGPNCNCLAVYDPVCGCDGVTYSNECEAICAGVSIAHPGECRRPCGGLTPLPPCDGGEFCKFPPGACNDPSVQGFCTEIPQACPDVWMPVCGCDGVTYGNDCEADAAGVSIAHPGPCVPNCAATRRLANAAAVYHPGIPVGVQIALTLPAGVVAVALEDAPPAGWVVSNISNGGFFDAANGKVKWGPFFAPSFPQAVSYMATPPNDTVGPHCFTGAVSLDGANQEICGEACLGPACPLMAADVPHENCDSCNAGVCTTCTNGACRDYRISLCELIGYACAWLTGCHDDLSGVTRAAFIWRSGECYCWDDAEENWFPAACAAGIGGCCDNSPGLRIGDGGSATIRVGSAGKILADGERGARSRRVLGPSALVSVNVLAPDNAMSMALEIIVPSGWAVSQISDEGKWDAGRRKVKWGPFMDSADRTVSFVVEPTTSRQIPWSNRSGLAAEFRGTVSFDGANQPINAR